MKIEIKLFANLKKLLPPHAEGSTATLEVEDGLTVAGLIEQLQVPKEMAQLVLVNGINIEEEYSRTLQEGDVVSVFPPVAGGIDHSQRPAVRSRESALSKYKEARPRRLVASC